ncbi:flagellar motor protein MotB [Acetobacter persici]|uniref:OmpA-like domain-containing protein n=1 Tax=Acetobacter persici TaxID=1076596 RepID=A0A1U9LJ00_9PROT|nr:flagellar motor protein MotB [Acetobacter persici]AQT06329.1 hypothetical protein A0U91_15000 [Acetobacter persici]
MPEENEKRPIIIKRIEDGGHGHHGGAWKIAYADFMTAMMAFFLLMWLINATTEEQKKGIAQFFNPMADKAASTAATQSMLESSPINDPSSLKTVKNADQETLQGGAGQADKQAYEDITSGIEDRATPRPPAIIPIGGPNSGASKAIGIIGQGAGRSEQAAVAQQAASENETIEEALEKIKDGIKSTDASGEIKDNISFEVGSDEIRIEMRDTDKVPMFDTGAIAPNKAGSAMLSEIGKWLSPLPEKISIVGETDAVPYHLRKDGKLGLSNWTLSEMRADAAREILVKAGYPDKNIDSVVGKSDRNLAVPEKPSAAENRRVVIIIHRTHPIPSSLLAGEAKLPVK